jgi:dynein assembly factor 1
MKLSSESAMQLTEAAIKARCREHNLYMTPSLNDVLYCNSGGFSTLTGLEAYCNVKSIFFENNAVADLLTMPLLPRLKCL